MNTKNAILTTTLSLIAIVAIGTMTQLDNAFAEESGYKMADGVEAVFTFTFRDGVEVHKFPVFKMGENVVSDAGVSFSVEGVISSGPHLHKALDEAYNFRLQTSGGSSFEYDYRYFDVDVDFVKDGQSIKTLRYHDCDISDYSVTTLTASYESYMSSSSGFAIVDSIDFDCGGLNSVAPVKATTWKTSATPTTTDFGTLDYKYANDVRTFVTFAFKDGIEKIEFPYFELTSGYEETSSTVPAEFNLEGVVGNYPLLYQAIDNARKVSGQTGSFNTDFDTLVEFVQDGKTLRALSFNDCRIGSAEITTQYDKEEGFTGKSGFALVHQIDFECAGLKPINSGLKALYGDTPVWKTSTLSNTQPNHEFPTSGNVHAVTTFIFLDGQEVIDFPLYIQGEVLARSNPTFELAGVVGNTPLLYKAVDQNLKLRSQTGLNQLIDEFSVDVELKVDGKTIRGFNYADCRVTDYVVKSQRDKEESYFKGFALTNELNFECSGYHPNNPIYDAMFVVDKAKNISSVDLRETHDWADGFVQ